MFKKRTVSKKKQARNTRSSDDASDDEEGGTLDRIEQAKKKQKILTEVQSKRGVDTTELIQPAKSAPKEESSTVDKSASNAAESSGDGILDQKHRKAMEDYVNQKIASSGDDKAKASNASASGSAHQSLSEDALYQELAEKARQFAGKGIDASNPDRDDSGDGGAVLVAGTGIAEVILPAQERVKLEQDTEKAKAARADWKREQRADPAPARPEAVPNRFSVPSIIRPKHDKTPGRDEKNQTSSSPVPDTSETTKGSNSVPDNEVDDGRVGFEALKQRHHGIKKATQPKFQSNDHRVFQNFVTRQRDMRK